jgi:hypothetical protein
VAVLLCLMHMLAALVCAPLPIPFDYRVALLLAIVSAFFWNMYTFMQRTPKRVNWSKEEGWTITDRHGAEHHLQPQPEAYIGTWLVVAYFKDEAGKKRTVMLAQDSVRVDAFRRLKVLLRYGTPKA